MSEATTMPCGAEELAPVAEPFKRNVLVGTMKDWDDKPLRVFTQIKYTAEGRLSISGVTGPRSNGDTYGACGQNRDDLRKVTQFGAKLNEPIVERLARIWEEWHLNDVRAGCTTQREEWPVETLDTGRPNCQTYENEHPDGYLMKPCPVCGYKYGERWLSVNVPSDIIAWLRNLPQNDGIPAAWRV